MDVDDGRIEEQARLEASGDAASLALKFDGEIGREMLERRGCLEVEPAFEQGGIEVAGKRGLRMANGLPL